MAAGAVVSGTVPPRAMAVGNPAQCMPIEAGEPPQAPVAQRDLEPTGLRASRDEVRAAIIEWLDDTGHFGEAANLITSDFVSLRRSGVLDSLGLVQLVVMLEKRFGVSLDRDLLANPEGLSMNTFLDLVAGTKEARS